MSAQTPIEPVTEPPAAIGVCGAGTMGAGIAQLACRAGARTLVYDPEPRALAQGTERVRAGLARDAQRGRLSAAQAQDAAALLEPVTELEALAPCELVIEAAPESLELKRELLARLAEISGPDTVLATNTSSLLVAALAAGVPGPERVLGMHFFNPPPAMALLELVAGVDTSEHALALARAAGEAMGKRVIAVADGIGFLVNRCNRPFTLEAQRLVTERLAEPEAVDRICRLEGGFRMGPFELMDLVGVDVGLEIARSFYEQSFGEPRWRPSPLVARMVAAGRLGRKSGRGFYTYGAEGGHRPPDPDPPAAGGGAGLVVIAGESALAFALAQAALEAGWDVASPAEALGGPTPELILDLTGDEEPEAPLQGAPQAICCHAGSLAAQDPGGAAVGFHALMPLGGLVELTRGPDSSDAAAAAAQRFFATLGMRAEWVGDAPGLVLGRIVCQLINEAAYALDEGVGSARDIDAGVVYGLNFPRGILAWADEIGIDHVLAVLDALALERGEERYRAAPALRRLGWAGRLGHATGEGFHAYEPDAG